jgi:site-specific recombinase XerD
VNTSANRLEPAHAEPSHIIIARYNDFQRRRGYTKSTIMSRRHRLSAFSFHLARRTPPVHILDATPAHAVAWLDAHPDITDFTRGLYISCLSAFYTWAFRTDLITTNPMLKVDRPKPTHRLPRPAGDDDLARCLAYARANDLRMAAWICLGAYQGFRCIEISRLCVHDVDRKNMAIRAFGKGNKERVVPLHKETLIALIRYGLPESGYVFRKLSATPNRNPNPDPLNPATISLYGGRFFRDLGSDIKMHQLRHWFGTQVNRGSDLLSAKELMGHSSTATTELYTKVDVERFAPVVGRLAI